jgi:hypothetical protein
MIRIEQSDTDAFVTWLARVVNGVVALSEPAAVHIVELDHWFDQKWRGFSGKALGAVGRWGSELTVPPFHPHRVLGEHHFTQDGGPGQYTVVTEAPKLHRDQSSSENLQRRMSLVAPETACFWYSGDVAAAGRGALMAYLPDAEDYSAWYVGLARASGTWRPVTLAGIGPSELAQLEEAASGRLAG